MKARKLICDACGSDNGDSMFGKYEGDTCRQWGCFGKMRYVNPKTKKPITNLYKQLRWCPIASDTGVTHWFIEPFIFLDYQDGKIVKCFPLWLEVSIMEPTPEVFEVIPPRERHQTIWNHRRLPYEEFGVDVKNGPSIRTHPQCFIYRAVATRHPRGDILSCKIIDGWIWTIAPKKLTPKMVASEKRK